MHLFKRSERTGAPYYVKYVEVLPNGRRQQRLVSTRTHEHAAAKKVAMKIISDAAMRTYGLIDAEAERFKNEARRTIEEHLLDFGQRLKSRSTGTNALRNVNGQLNYIRGFASYAQIKIIGHINADLMNQYIAHLRENGRSARTVGAMIGASKHFTSWLRKHGKLKSDPLETVERPDPESDRKLNRRMLKLDEWQWLVKATLAGPERYEMAAEARCLAYRTAIQTGLRSSELKSLSRGSFELDVDRPYVKTASGQTKNRQTAYQYIDKALANDLRSFLATKMPQAKVFNLPHKYAAKMLQADILAARAMWLAEARNDPTERAKRESCDFLMPTNEAGDELDFHALRHTCGAWLAIQGEQPKVIQSVMRHSTISLPLDTYGHLIEGAEAAAVSRNGNLTAMPALQMATGTDSSLICLDTHLIPTRVRGACDDVRGGAIGTFTNDSTQQQKSRVIPMENAASCEMVQAVAKAEGKGVEPSTACAATDFESAS